MRKNVLLLIVLLLIPVLLFGLKKCPKCDRTFPDECKYCTQCGVKLVLVEQKLIPKPELVFLHINKKGYKEYRNNRDGSVLVGIPFGEFRMGSDDGAPDEKPVHIVYLDEYYIGKYEVTNRQYKKFCDEVGRSYPSDPQFQSMFDYFTSFPDYPVVNVSWEDAVAYCEWTGLRLPTEAEWEKAARGYDGRRFPWGNTFTDGSHCNFADKNSDYTWSYKSIDDGYRYVAPVIGYAKGISPYGCHNMAGNVWEWCSDLYESYYYKESPKSNPQGSISGTYRVVRGGSWYDDASGIRCASRYRDGSSHGRNCYGFRVVCSQQTR